jgi:hypothetical protein
MCKLKSLNAALALALGLGFGIAAAQSDQAAQQGNALDRPSNKADQQAVGIAAKPGAQAGPAAQRDTGQSARSAEQSSRPSGIKDELAYGDSARRVEGEVYVPRPSGKEQFAYEDSAMRADHDVYGWRPSEEEQYAQGDEDKTTGQGQGVRESGGQAGVQTPTQSGDSTVESLAGSDSAPDAGDQGTRGGA